MFNCPSAQIEQSLENAVVEHVIEAGNQTQLCHGQRRDALVRPRCQHHQRNPDAGEHDADVLNAVVGQSCLQVAAQNSIEDADQRGGAGYH